MHQTLMNTISLEAYLASPEGVLFSIVQKNVLLVINRQNESVAKRLLNPDLNPVIIQIAGNHLVKFPYSKLEKHITKDHNHEEVRMLIEADSKGYDLNLIDSPGFTTLQTQAIIELIQNGKIIENKITIDMTWPQILAQGKDPKCHMI